VTPTASVVSSESKNFGKPVVAYHFLNGGDVIGNYSTISITDGAFKRIEFGYTAEIQAQGTDHTNAVNLAPLWTNTMSIIHGKLNVIPENAFHTKWMPAISIGGIGRFNDNNVGDGSNSAALHKALSITNGLQTSKNADVYLVGTKVVTQFIPKVPVLLSGGVRGTNAVLWGLAGNSVDFEARAFGAAGFVFTGPAKSTIILAAEVSQQPRHTAVTLDNGQKVGIFDFPTSEVYAIRVLPFHRYKLNVDIGVLQAAGHIGASPTLPSVPVDLNARSRVAFGLSYAF